MSSLGVWLVAATLLFGLALVSKREQNLPFYVAAGVALLLSPLASVLSYPELSYEGAFAPLVVFTTILFLVSIGTPKFPYQSKWAESRLRMTKRTALFLAVSLAIVAVCAFIVLRNLVASGPVSDLYELNVAAASDASPSAGVAGRLLRLGVPFGIACFSAFIFSARDSGRLWFLAFALAFAATQLSVRRSIFIYMAAFYFLIYLCSVTSLKQFARSAVAALGALVGVLLFFGGVQVATHKASAGDAFQSGLDDGLLYFAGNLPYSECLSQTGSGLPRGASFPILSRLIIGEGFYGKPFCSVSGRLFNTSPAYFDIASDVGLGGVIVVAVAVALFLFVPRQKERRVGLYVLILGFVLFSFRENLLGQLDILQSVVVYPVVLALLARSSRIRVKPSQRVPVVRSFS